MAANWTGQDGNRSVAQSARPHPALLVMLIGRLYPSTSETIGRKWTLWQGQNDGEWLTIIEIYWSSTQCPFGQTGWCIACSYMGITFYSANAWTTGTTPFGITNGSPPYTSGSPIIRYLQSPGCPGRGTPSGRTWWTRRRRWIGVNLFMRSGISVDWKTERIE